MVVGWDKDKNRVSVLYLCHNCVISMLNMKHEQGFIQDFFPGGNTIDGNTITACVARPDLGDLGECPPPPPEENF